jgi:hypothetical protein
MKCRINNWQRLRLVWWAFAFPVQFAVYRRGLEIGKHEGAAYQDALEHGKG